MLCLVNGGGRVSGFPSISSAATLAKVWTDTMVAVQQWVLNRTLQLLFEARSHSWHGRNDCWHTSVFIKCHKDTFKPCGRWVTQKWRTVAVNLQSWIGHKDVMRLIFTQRCIARWRKEDFAGRADSPHTFIMWVSWESELLQELTFPTVWAILMFHTTFIGSCLVLTAFSSLLCPSQLTLKRPKAPQPCTPRQFPPDSPLGMALSNSGRKGNLLFLEWPLCFRA